MSSLDKMSIMGVRSFAPKQTQMVYFFSPLTLILGPNGSGKTTIIESLRYVTTGEMPPNSGRGSAFVHDPKIADESIVQGQIKLKFNDVRGQPVTTTRSMSVSQKQKKIEFKSVDGTMLRKDDTGKDVSISSKCAELDREMVACLGVSKAILNNVIFCHQEDSNWPLSEGKALKVKFDEIFAATRYIKALDNLHKIRVERDGQCKIFETELKYLVHNQKHAAELRADLQKTETKLGASRDRVKRIQEKLNPIEEKLEDISKKERIVGSVHTKIEKMKSELKVEVTVCNELEEKIVNVITGTDEELAQQVNNFNGQLEEKKDEQRTVVREIKRLEEEIPTMNDKRSHMQFKLGKLNTEAEQHQNRIKARDSLIRNLCSTYHFTGVPIEGELSSAVIDSVKREMKTKIRSLEQELQRLKAKYDEQETAVRDKLITSRASQAKIEEKLSTALKETTAKREEKEKINMDLTRLDALAPRLQIIEDELKRKENELQETTAQINISAAQLEIDAKEREVKHMDHEIRDLDVEMMKLADQADLIAKLELAKKDKVRCEETIRKIKSKDEDVLTHLLGSIPTAGISDAMAKLTKNLSKEIQQLRDRRERLQVAISACDASSKMNTVELRRKEEELREYEERVKNTDGSRNLEDSLNKLQTTIKNLHDEKGAMTGSTFLYTKFIEKLKKPEPCCPLCHRGFDDRQDVDDLVKDLQMKVRNLPDDMESKTNTLKEYQDKYNCMLELKPVKTRMEALNKIEIPELKAKVRKFDEDKEKNRTLKVGVEEMLMLKQADESAAAEIQPDLAIMEQNRIELMRAEKIIEQLGRQLGGGGGRTMAQVSQEKKDLQTKLDVLQSSFKAYQQRISDHRERVQGLTTHVNSLKSEHLQISHDMQKVNEMEARRSLLMKEIAAAKSLTHQLNIKVEPLKHDIATLEKERKSLTETKERAAEKSQKLIAEAKAKEKEIVDLQNDISRYVEAKCQDVLADCQQELDLIDARLKTCETKQQAMNAKSQNISKEIDNQQTQVRDLKDNQELRRKQKRIQEIQRDIIKLKEELGGFDINTMHIEKESLNKQMKTLNGEKHSAEGGQQELETNIAKLKKELSGNTYGEADKNYKKKLIELKTTELASKDLRTYSQALDRAIMQYHSLKMKEINKIVRELWSKTYQGNDIDFIEIQSDIDDVANANTTGGRRKQYHYRVVMIKGGVEQDMRGRCSAGQKVLASLIIRLALAETFCLNCGILALDEPTTNLDRENIESLAEALTNIVKSRSQQRNFQLIVITHDEDFIERLGRSEYADFYHRIAKNEKGHSVVKKFEIQTLP